MRIKKMQYDVVAVEISTGTVRVIASDKDKENAEAIVAMALMRRGCNEEFFQEVPQGSYSDGQKWTSK